MMISMNIKPETKAKLRQMFDLEYPIIHLPRQHRNKKFADWLGEYVDKVVQNR